MSHRRAYYISLRQRKPRGIALVAVLSILTVLAVMAAVFYTHITLESQTSKNHTAIMQVHFLAESAVEHARAILREDARQSPHYDDTTDIWRQTLVPTRENPDDGYLLAPTLRRLDEPDSRWWYVRDDDDNIIGRYAIRIEDEASKVHLNVAAALGRENQNEGVGPFEIIISDGQRAGLPIPLTFAHNILSYRYGRDRRPGQAHVDDTHTAMQFAFDRIDNDADGIVDQPGEGIDDPMEYCHVFPLWDDRSLSTFHSLSALAPDSLSLSPRARRQLEHYATLHSSQRPAYWDRRDNTWRAPLNLNAATRRQLQTFLARAHSAISFEASDVNRRTITANILDYRDENHVLTTVGNEYGIESVVFNEILANNGSFTIRADRNNPASNTRDLVHRYGWWYELVHYQKQARSYRFGWRMTRVSGNSSRAVIRLNDEPRLDTQRERDAFRQFATMTDNLRWIPDMWKNAYLMVYKSTTNVYDNYYVPYLITGNSHNELYVRSTGRDATFQFLLDQVNNVSGTFNTVKINNFWRNNPGGLVSVVPEVTEVLYCPVSPHLETPPPRDLYYNVYIGENNLPGSLADGSAQHVNTHHLHAWEPPLTAQQTPYKGFYPYLDLNGDPQRYSETRMSELTVNDLRDTTLTLPGGVDRAWLLRTPYNDGEPIRPQDGNFRIVVSTCRGAGAPNPRSRAAFENKNVVQRVFFMRPDIIELHNISEFPISLAQWRIMINTGSRAHQISRIRHAAHFCSRRNTRYNNPYPVIEPNGYFYLTNHRNIFDLEYGGSRDGTWGNSPDEAFPVAEIPDFLWGARYEIEHISLGKIKVKGANWERDQLKYETCEWLLREPRHDQNSPYGIVTTILGNTRDTLDVGNVNILSVRRGDDILIRGLPRQGGFVSMTLRNEYDQITARTVDYAGTEPHEFFTTSIKTDPARYTWTKSSRPTFGGTRRTAQNPVAIPSHVHTRVKNSDYVSAAEIQHVRSANDWQNLVSHEHDAAGTRILRATTPYLTTDAIRLNPDQDGVHVSGWNRAYATAQSATANAVSSRDTRWSPNTWNGQTLRIHSGALSGEQFGITSNTRSTVYVDGNSMPGGKILSLESGDTFSVGPGYTTPFFYTQNNAESGIWEWKNARITPGYYALYLRGLNDAISTTEFLEENHNAELQVSLYNYQTDEYDDFPLDSTPVDAYFSDYLREPRRRHMRYDKNDTIFSGIITPAHISPQHGIRLRLTAHGLNNPQGSGIAWFNYALLTPRVSHGRVNINTAPTRVINALNGMTPALAMAIRTRQSGGRPNAFPRYETVADLLRVDGMTPEIFAKNVNLITTRSEQFRVRIIAQSLNNATGDPGSDDDKVVATTTQNIIIDRPPMLQRPADPATSFPPLRILSRDP